MTVTGRVVHAAAKAAFGRLGRPSGVVGSRIILRRRCLSSPSSAQQQGKQHLVVALGGNALLQRGEPMTIANQRKNVAEAVASLEYVLTENAITFVHGNGPQVGLLALESATYEKETGVEHMQLDVLDAQTEGMIGYLIEQELHSRVNHNRGIVTVLSQIVVNPEDPAFRKPTKFIGPVYTNEEAEGLLELKQDGEYFRRQEGDEYYKRDGEYFRRVVASPLPLRLIEQEMLVVRMLTDNNCIVICAGGGGIPVIEDPTTKKLQGVEAVIDKDRAATMLGLTLNADGMMILTDVQGVAQDFGTPDQKWIKTVAPGRLWSLMDQFPDGSMGPKVESAIEFVNLTGKWSAIGSLTEADKMLKKEAGTLITSEHGPDHIEYY